MLFVACPFWAEQNYSVCSSFVNIYGILFTIISAYFLVRVVLRESDSGYIIIIAIFLGIIAIGIYQALLYLLMANYVIFLSLSMYVKHGKVGGYLLAGIRCVFMITCELKVCSTKKPWNPTVPLALPAAPELSALCVIRAPALKGGKNVSGNNT